MGIEAIPSFYLEGGGQIMVMEQPERDHVASEEMGKLADLLRKEGYKPLEMRATTSYVSSEHVGVCLSANLIRYVRALPNGK
jgi:hypothetical protein